MKNEQIVTQLNNIVSVLKMDYEHIIQAEKDLHWNDKYLDVEKNAYAIATLQILIEEIERG